MPAAFAFILCLTFVVALLKLDHQRFKMQSIASWIPMFWMLYCGSKPFGQWFASNRIAEDFSIAEGSAMDRNFLLILIVSALFILARRKIDWDKVIKDNRWLLLLFVYMLISILWSDYPYVSFKRWIRASGPIVIALLVLTGPSPREEVEAILRKTVYILILFSVLLVKYYPQLGMKWGKWSGEAVWVGATMSKNTLGSLCMISVLFLIWIWIKRMREKEQLSFSNFETMAHVVVLCLTLWMLKGPGSYSATSLVVLIIGVATLFIVRRLKASAHFGAMSGLFLVVGLAYLLLSINPVDIVAPLMGRETNLTGRDTIWGMLIPVAMEHPVLGLGYGGYWIEPLQLNPKLAINQAHNGYIDIFIELGIIGLLLFAIVIANFFKKANDIFKYDIEWGSLQYAVLFMSLIHNVTESTYLGSTMFLWNILLLLMVAIPREGSVPSRMPIHDLKIREVNRIIY